MTGRDTTVAVVGGGIMGADIAVSCAAAGWTAHVMSPSQKTRDGLPGRITGGLAKLGADPARAALVRVYPALTDLPWQDIGLVIEAATEKLDLKKQIYSELETLAGRDVPLATNTSSFQIHTVGGHLKTRDRVIGAHYFMPAHIVPLVEVVMAEFTTTEVADRVETAMKATGKVPVRVKKDIPGFLANRMQHALIREALWLLDNGVADMEGIDAAVRYGFGFRFVACGPLMQKEFSGWDTNYYAGCTIYPSLSNADKPPQMFQQMVERGHIGMKAKHGLRPWSDEEIAREKARYEKALQGGFEILKADMKGRD